MDTDCAVLNLGEFSCHICLLNYDEHETNTLNAEVEYGDDTLLLRDVYLQLLQATKIQSSAIDALLQPARICSECTNRLLSAYELICTLEKSEVLLQEFLTSEPALLSQAVPLSSTAHAVDVQAVKAEIITSDRFVLSPIDNEGEDLEMLDTEFLYEESGDCEAPLEESAELIVTSASKCVFDADTKVKLEIPDESGNDATSPTQFTTDTTEGVTASDKKKSLVQKAGTATWPRFSIGSRLGTYETSRWHKCDVCQRAFAKFETLEKHVKAVHTSVSPELIAALAPKPTEEQPLQCSHCPRTFARKYALRRHTLAMHGKVMESDDTDTIGGAKKKAYRCKRGLCPHCGRSFSQASLVIHIRRHTGEKPYQCDLCEKGFPRRQDLVIHKRQHTGERPHVCTICGKSFIRPNKLSRHLRIHTGLRPYKCSECDKSFAQSNDLRIHMRRHTGEKPYKCNVCGEGFICGTALKNHRKLSSHEPSAGDAVDPYAKCRVNTRTSRQVTYLSEQ